MLDHAPWLPLVFFGTLLLTRLSSPTTLVFDEVHYIPAAKALVELRDNLNWEHPPLAKLIMGTSWLVFTKWLGLFSEPFSFRLITMIFGLLILWSVRGWMKRLGFTEGAAQAGVWLTGFNFLWFVQSRTTMLDPFFLAFTLWGILFVYAYPPKAHPGSGNPDDLKPHRYWIGWALLGAAAASKWALAPYLIIPILFGSGRIVHKAIGCAIAGAVYVASFLPLGFLAKGAVPITDLIQYHKTMLNGFNSIASASHPYASHWWQWPLLTRPMWYAFEHLGGKELCIWAGGNPLLFWTAIPFLIGIVVYAILKRRTESGEAAKMLAALYWVPLLFWAVAPRKLQMYYYYFPPSIWVGPIVVWAHETLYVGWFLRRRGLEAGSRPGKLLFLYTVACALVFLYFLPIMDGRPLQQGRYQVYMWLQSWI